MTNQIRAFLPEQGNIYSEWDQISVLDVRDLLRGAWREWRAGTPRGVARYPVRVVLKNLSAFARAKVFREAQIPAGEAPRFRIGGREDFPRYH